MGYFNYFIKCIIRNIAYRLCKPKVLLTVLFSVAILFILHTTGYCAEWTDGEIEQCLNALADVTSNQGVIISQLSSMGVDVKDIENSLNEVKNDIDNINTYVSNINEVLTNIFLRVNAINTTITNIYNTLEENQKELITELQTENEKVLNELEDIKNILLGTDTHLTGFFFSDKLQYAMSSPSLNTSGNYHIVDGINFGYVSIGIQLEPGYTYTFVCNSYDSSDSSGIYYTFGNISIGNTISVVNLGSFSPNSAALSITPKKSYSNIKLLFTNPSAFTGTDWSIYRKSSSSLSSVTENIDKSNQLQQDQNNLQQEQNDLIKDDNVNTEGFEFATNDTDNPTEEGFNTLFTAVYNAFCSTSSEPLKVTLPYINESFIIQPNLVSNAMQKCGLGFVSTLIQSFYYYSVCLFIYKDINKIIEHLKSGNLTADCGNVKTEVL